MLPTHHLIRTAALDSSQTNPTTNSQYTAGYVAYKSRPINYIHEHYAFKAKGGAQRKWCGRRWPALYSVAKSAGGCGSEVARGRGLSQLETVGLPL